VYKKPIGVFDTATKTFTAAPQIDYRSLLNIAFYSMEQPAPAPPSPGEIFARSGVAASALPNVAITSVNGNHLHYGGSPVATNGFIGCKPQKGRTFRQQKRLELMVQMENAQIPEHMAAAMLGISLTRLKGVKKSLDYLKARMQLTLGIVVDHGQRLETIKEQRKEVLTQMLPQALQVIAHVVSKPTATLTVPEQKLQVAVAQDLLDREGSLAKVSKTEVKQVDRFDWNHIDQAGRSIIDVIRGAAQQNMGAGRASQVQDVINLSHDFSNSRTLNVAEQQAALDELEREALIQVEANPPRFQN
jgi:hypothetical protein